MSTDQSTTPTAAFTQSTIGPTHPQQQTIWQHYLTAWTDQPPQQHNHHIILSTTPHFTYTDKLASSTGTTQLTAHMQQFQSQMSGASFRSDSLVLHHSYGRAEYTMVDSSGKDVLKGTDFIEVADDGRLCKVVGFF